MNKEASHSKKCVGYRPRCDSDRQIAILMSSIIGTCGKPSVEVDNIESLNLCLRL